MNSIAQKIKEGRLQAKMTEKDLAKKCGVAPSYIIDIESGKKVINETTAAKIFAVLGLKSGLDFNDMIVNEPEVIQKPVKKEVPKETLQPAEPNAQWSEALGNLIRKYPVYAASSDKIVSYKEIPVLNKKADGLPWDKVTYIQMTDSNLHQVRLFKDDIVQVHLMKEYSGKGAYWIEMGGKRMVKYLIRESSMKMALHESLGDDEAIVVESSKIKLIGKCIKAEFCL